VWKLTGTNVNLKIFDIPASIPISPHEKQWLKKIIEEQYQLQLTDSFNCKKLSVILESKFGLSVSYNTFRRLFNVVPAPDYCTSLFTLNSICTAIGFANFNAFKKHIVAFDFAAFNEVLMVSLFKRKADHNKITAGISTISASNWEEAFLIKSVVDLCIQLNDYVLLKKVIDIPFQINQEAVHQRIFISFQNIYIESANGNKKMIAFVLKHIRANIVLQKILLQTYVLEQLLSGFWGKWLAAADCNLIDDMPVFSNILLCQKAFMEKDLPTSIDHFKKTINALKIKDVFIHPILLGRVAAWEMILNQNDSSLYKYYSGLKKEFDQVYFLVFYCRLIWTYRDEKIQIDLIESIDISKFPLIFNVFDSQIVSKFYVTLSVHFHQIKDTQKAMKALQKANDLRLDTENDTNWYFAKYHELKKIYLA
jgi:tetratricopeptide (TPR) repeat protein